MSDPIGVILAGGSGRRMGGAKATALLAGRPLLSYPLAAMQAALPDVVVLAKADTALPALVGVEVWTEPAEPRHPLAGILAALELAGGRPVLVCAVDLPFVTPELLGQIAGTTASVAVAAHRGTIQPLLGLYRPEAARLLGTPEDTMSVREAVSAIGPQLIEVGDPEQLFNVNTAADLRAAEATLASRR